MQITVEIPDHLAAEAQARGLHLDRRVAELLTDDLAVKATLSKEESERRNAAVDAMLQFYAARGFTTGGQDLNSMVHEGRKY